MTAANSGGDKEINDADALEQETKKSYYHGFDDETVKRLQLYFKVHRADNDALLRYLKARRVPTTTPNDV